MQETLQQENGISSSGAYTKLPLATGLFAARI
jgi:hypothetical protein